MVVKPSGAHGSSPPRLHIGEWQVDPATNELRRGSETVRLEPKSMEVLVLLASREGRVVSREELFAAVWPGVVVGDEALTQSIIKLRRALGDNPRAPAYIETISKRGYRLVAAVRQDGPLTPRARWKGAVAAAAFAILLATVYFFRPAAQPVEADAAEAPESAAPTVAVLPFEWLAPDGEREYLARGISSDLRTQLSRLPGLRAISARSAAAPGAQYLVTGSVQHESGMLRINIHLVDTRSRRELWSERFERPFGDLFAVQDEITRRLTELLPGKLTEAQRQHVARRYTRSLAAYDHFLRAQALFLARQADGNEEARRAYRKALELDPNFARAYAGLAMTYAMDYRLRPGAESEAALARSFELAESARLIDPDIPEVFWALGFVHAQSRRHDLALQSLQQAIALDPSFADAYALMGGVHTYLGQPAKTIPLLRTAMRLNPDGGYLYFLLLGRAYLFGNDLEQALINLRAASVRNPVDLETRLYLAAALSAAGDRSGADQEVDEVRLLKPGFSIQAWLETYPMASTAQRNRLETLLAAAGLAGDR